MATPPRPQTQCRLLALPPEIRNRIYDYTLYVATTDGKVTIDKRSSAKAYSVLSLLQTCRQVNQEAEGMFYRINHLRSENLNRWSYPPNFWYGLGERRRESIRTLTVRIWMAIRGANGILVVPKIHLCTNLEALNLELDTEAAETIILAERQGRGILQLQSSLASLKNLKGIRLIPPPLCGWLARCKKIEAELQQAVERQRARTTRKSPRWAK